MFVVFKQVLILSFGNNEFILLSADTYSANVEDSIIMFHSAKSLRLLCCSNHAVFF